MLLSQDFNFQSKSTEIQSNISNLKNLVEYQSTNHVSVGKREKSVHQGMYVVSQRKRISKPNPVAKEGNHDNVNEGTRTQTRLYATDLLKRRLMYMTWSALTAANRRYSPTV